MLSAKMREEVRVLLSLARQEDSSFARKFEEVAAGWLSKPMRMSDVIEGQTISPPRRSLDMVGLPMDASKGKADRM